MPNASFDVIRTGNLSEDSINLVSTTIDPEGDEITYLWESSLDGVISNESSWQGHLSRGVHVISLSVNDGRMEHINSTSIATEIVNVENSPPRAVIHTPLSGTNYDSSNLFEFNASALEIGIALVQHSQPISLGIVLLMNQHQVLNI